MILLQQLTSWNLDFEVLRGQAFDGAGTMAGKSRRAAARIISRYPMALFTHCMAHRLNLYVVRCCHMREVDNMMQIVQTK